jgi:uncharacterized membrane protein
MWSYKNRIERDLARWRQQGWVTADGAASIAADLKAHGSGIRVANVLGTLAAVLIGFAVMSFVAANWQYMPKMVRLGTIFAALWVAYLAAAALFQRGQTGFGNAAALAGSAIFGAGIMLISQMYHMDGNAPDAMLLWSAGALVTGLILRSPPAAGFAMVLAAIWGGWESGQREVVFWQFLPVWAVISAAFYWLKWPPGLHLSALALSLFVISLGAFLGPVNNFELVLLIGLALTALSIAGEKLQPRLHALWPNALPYALAIAFIGFLALQFGENPSRNEFIMLSVAALALALAAIWWGLTSPNRGALWVGYIAFSIEILAIYQKTVGSLMGTSLFFLVAGLIVAGLAAMAMKLANRNTQSEALT